MPIKNQNILADRLKGIKIGEEELTPEKLLEIANSEEEIELTASEGTFLLNDELDQLKSTVGNGSMRDGVISGAEQTIKAIKKATGLEYEGKIVKTNDGLVDFESTVNQLKENLTGKLEKSLKVPKDEKIQELESSLNKLRETYENESKQWESKESEWEQRYTGLKKDNYLSSFASKIEGKKPNHILAAFKADGYDVDLSNGTPVPLLNGQPIKDKLEKPVALESVFNSWAIENNFVSNPEGRGERDETGSSGGKFKSSKEAYDYMKENNIDPTSTEADELLQGVED